MNAIETPSPRNTAGWAWAARVCFLLAALALVCAAKLGLDARAAEADLEETGWASGPTRIQALGAHAIAEGAGRGMWVVGGTGVVLLALGLGARRRST